MSFLTRHFYKDQPTNQPAERMVTPVYFSETWLTVAEESGVEGGGRKRGKTVTTFDSALWGGGYIVTTFACTQETNHRKSETVYPMAVIILQHCMSMSHTSFASLGRLRNSRLCPYRNGLLFRHYFIISIYKNTAGLYSLHVNSPEEQNKLKNTA